MYCMGMFNIFIITVDSELRTLFKGLRWLVIAAFTHALTVLIFRGSITTETGEINTGNGWDDFTMYLQTHLVFYMNMLLPITLFLYMQFLP